MDSLRIVPTLLNSIFLLIRFTMPESAPRLCGADFKTIGRCFFFEDTPKSWHVADTHCRQNLPLPGYLGFVKDQETQSLLETEVQKKGWSNTWISGKVTDRRWSWFTSWKWLAFQGCWRDETSNRDLPAEVPGITTPALCIEACTDMEYEYAGVQLGPSGGLLCHCGKKFGKHGRAYDEGCDNSCPSQTPDSEVIDKKCGGPDLQLVFYTGDTATPFHHFAPSKLRRFENCVVYDHTVNHQWTEQNCQMKQGVICLYFHGESSCLWHNLTWTDGACVSIHNMKMDYYEGLAYCRVQNGILARVYSAAVNSAILRNLDPNVSYFILLNAQHMTTSYYDIITGYVNFADFQPSTEKDQDCFVMRSADNYMWSTVNCDIQYPFVCMLDIELGSTSPLPNGNTTSTHGPPAQVNIYVWVGVGVGASIVLIAVIIITTYCILRKKKERADGQQRRHRRKRPADTQVSPNNYESKGHRPGLSDRRGRGHQAQSGHLPPDGRGEELRDRAGHLATSSSNELEHRYESLKKGTDKVDQDPEYEHYMEIAS